MRRFVHLSRILAVWLALLAMPMIASAEFIKNLPRAGGDYTLTVASNAANPGPTAVTVSSVVRTKRIREVDPLTAAAGAFVSKTGMLPDSLVRLIVEVDLPETTPGNLSDAVVTMSQPLTGVPYERRISQDTTFVFDIVP